MNQVCFWFIDEFDFRGFDEEFGWIYVFVYGVDLLIEIVKMKYFLKDDSLKILIIIKRVMIIDDILILNG